MTIRIEFYGIVRERAGVASIDVEANELRDVFAELESRLPRLAATCFQNGRLRPGYLANIDGRTFASDPSTPLAPGTTVLILSADAGG